MPQGTWTSFDELQYRQVIESDKKRGSPPRGRAHPTLPPRPARRT